jgi:hypothetical protein
LSILAARFHAHFSVIRYEAHFFERVRLERAFAVADENGPAIRSLLQMVREQDENAMPAEKISAYYVK